MIDDAKITSELSTCYSGVVNDVLLAMGLRNFVLPIEITPLIPDAPLCGPAFTIEGHPAEGTDGHGTLLAWTGLLSKAPAGHVWISQPHTTDLAQMGELSAEVESP